VVIHPSQHSKNQISTLRKSSLALVALLGASLNVKADLHQPPATTSVYAAPLCRVSVGPAECEFQVKKYQNAKYPEYLVVDCRRTVNVMDAQKRSGELTLNSKWHRGLSSSLIDNVSSQVAEDIEIRLLAEPQLIARATKSLQKQAYAIPKCLLEIELKPNSTEQ
jgi:hypothetical protein